MLVANLSYLLSDRKKSTERLITNDDGKDKFYLTDGGLLYTSGPLDRETRDTYMFTVLVGRRGLPRGFRSQQAIQVKVGGKNYFFQFCQNIFFNDLTLYSPVLGEG